MREYPLDLTKSVMSGLSRESLGRNTSGCRRLLGLRPRDGALVRGDVLVNPLDLDVSWPFPQILPGQLETIIGDTTALYLVDEKFSWTRSELLTGIPHGGGWHDADFGRFRLLFNGECFVLRSGLDVSLYSSGPFVQTGCNHNGRLVWGGLDDGFWSAAWKAELATWLALESTGLTAGYEMYPNTVMWGAIGGGDLMCWLTDPSSTSYPVVGPLGSGYGYDSDRPFYQDMLRRGDIGWTRMPWSGTVRCVLPAGNAVVAYGDNGVSFLPVFGTGYGLVPLSNEIGIMGRSAVASSGDKEIGHVFLGSDKELYRVSTEGKLTRLGYKDHLVDLDGGTVISYDSTWKEFYICNNRRGFVLSQYGLAELERSNTSFFRQNGKVFGPWMRTDEAETHFLIETEDVSIGSGSSKRIQTEEILVDGITNLEGRMEFQTDEPSKRWRRSSWRRFNNQGSCYLGLSVCGARLHVKGDIVDDSATLTEFRLRWQVADNRNARGPYSGPQTESSGNQ